VKKLWAVLKLLFVSTYFTWRGKKDYTAEKQVFLSLLLLLAFLPLVRILFAVAGGVYQAGVMLGEPSLILLLATVAGQLTVLFFAVPYLLAAFYYSEDLPRLASLPLAPWQFLGAKFVLVWLEEIATLLIPVGPAAVVYGSAAGLPLYWLVLPLVLVLLPALPLGLAALLTLVLLRLTDLPRHREAMRVFAALLGVVIALGLQALFLRSGDEPSSAVRDLVLAGPALAASLSRSFPPAAWAAQALAGAGTLAGLRNLFFFTVVSLGSVVLAGALTQRWFWHSFLRGLEEPQAANRSRRRPRRAARSGRAARRPFTACLLREARLFWRTPAFALNGVLNLFLLPLLILFPVLVQGKLQLLRQLLARHPEAPPLAGLILAAAVAFTAAMNLVASTAISREGRLFFWSQVLPLSPRVQVRAKLTWALLLQFPATLVWVLAARLVAGLPWTFALGGGALGFISAWPLAELGLLADLARPHLDWSDPQRAMKGNFNGFLAGLGGWLLLGIAAGALVLAFRVFGAFAPLYGVAALLFLLAGLVLDYGTVHYAERRYRTIGA